MSESRGRRVKTNILTGAIGDVGLRTHLGSSRCISPRMTSSAEAPSLLRRGWGAENGSTRRQRRGTTRLSTDLTDALTDSDNALTYSCPRARTPISSDGFRRRSNELLTWTDRARATRRDATAVVNNRRARPLLFNASGAAKSLARPCVLAERSSTLCEPVGHADPLFPQGTGVQSEGRFEFRKKKEAR